MRKVNNDFDDCYYLDEEGKLYNIVTKKEIKQGKNHLFILRTKDNRRKKISLKTLYKLVYNRPYSKNEIENLENEQWKEIEDTNQLYYISNKGRILSLQGYETIILKPFNNQGGYLRVDIIENGKRQTKLVHRLVAAAFLPLPQKLGMQLHHKDFDKNNNAAENLQWLTPVAHAKKHKENKKDVLEQSKSEKNCNQRKGKM